MNNIECKPASHEFEKWFDNTFNPKRNPYALHYKQTLLMGWNSAKELALKEINSSVNFYTNATGYDEPMISKRAVIERISKL